MKMKSYMESLDLWDAVEEDYEVSLAAWKSHYGPNKASQGEKNQEDEGKDMSIC